jgi:hypothetical protein
MPRTNSDNDTPNQTPHLRGGFVSRTVELYPKPSRVTKGTTRWKHQYPAQSLPTYSVSL